MNTPIFKGGITGISDSKFSGIRGNAHRLVGIDYKSEPGIVKVQQALSDTSVLNEFCKIGVNLPDNSRLWFSSTSGKIWRDVNDVFTLVHTMAPITDFKEPNSVTSVFDDEDIESGISMSISENNFNYGRISTPNTSVIDAVRGRFSSVVGIDDNFAVVAYQGPDSDGFIKSFQFTSTGALTVLETLEHDTDDCEYNSLCKIDDTHYMLAYKGAYDRATIKTFSGPYTFSQLSSLEHDGADVSGAYNSLIQIDTTHYALAYSKGPAGHACIKIFTIDGAYGITQTSTLTHDVSGETYGHSLVKIDSTHLMLSYVNASYQQIIKTFAIDGAWNVTQIDSEIHEATTSSPSVFGSIIQIDSTHYAWSGKISNRGYVKVFTIDGSYIITETFSKDIKLNNDFPSLLKADEKHITLFGGGINSVGVIKTFEVTNSFELIVS